MEQADLQRLLRARIDAIADDVLIVAEEFGAFTDARRRIDLPRPIRQLAVTGLSHDQPALLITKRQQLPPGTSSAPAPGG